MTDHHDNGTEERELPTAFVPREEYEALREVTKELLLIARLFKKLYPVTGRVEKVKAIISKASLLLEKKEK